MKSNMEPVRGPSGGAAGFPPACRGDERGWGPDSGRPSPSCRKPGQGLGGHPFLYVTITGQGVPALGQAEWELGPGLCPGASQVTS